MYNGKLNQSKPTSALGFFVGLIFIGIGVFIAIPTFGTFGVFWTLIAAGITFFSRIWIPFEERHCALRRRNQ
jgi:hypothetical protein